MRLDRSGWGPGGRRFKSCLPDRRERPAKAGLSASHAARRRGRRGSNGDDPLHGWGEFACAALQAAMKRSHGSGHLYIKWPSYYGRWRGVDGRFVTSRSERSASAAPRTASHGPRQSEVSAVSSRPRPASAARRRGTSTHRRRGGKRVARTADPRGRAAVVSPELRVDAADPRLASTRQAPDREHHPPRRRAPRPRDARLPMTSWLDRSTAASFTRSLGWTGTAQRPPA